MSVEKKTSGGYQARWRDPDGRQRARTFKRKLDAERFLATVTVDTLQGRYIDPTAGRVTVGEYAKQWASGQPWRSTSRERTEGIIERQIVPRFGTMQLRAVRPTDVQQWVGHMSASKLKPTTVESYFRTLAAVMISARRDRLIHTSPCEGITLPGAERGNGSIVPLTVEQVYALADAMPERYRALVIVSAGLGLRQGEACGLTVDRVDFLRRRVVIDRQLVTPPAGLCVFGPPKTASSNRVLTLPQVVADELAAHLAKFPVGESTDEFSGLIFKSSTGAPLRRSTYSDAFRRAARDASVTATSHDLRHHCASLLISEGCSVKAVQHFLGHKNASETLDTYGHLWADDEDRIRAAIDGGLKRCARNVHGGRSEASG
jgi:integrase